MNYVLSQICVGIASVLLGISFTVKEKKKVLLLCVLSSILFSLQYLFLFAFTGMIMNIISVIRSIWFYVSKEERKIISLIILNVLFVIGCVLTWQGIISLLPLFASSMFTYSLWQRKSKVYAILEFPVSVCWIIYNVILGSILGCIFEIVLLIFVIYSFIKFRKIKENEVNGKC